MSTMSDSSYRRVPQPTFNGHRFKVGLAVSSRDRADMEREYDMVSREEEEADESFEGLDNVRGEFTRMELD